MDQPDFDARLRAVPSGYSEVWYRGRRYGLSRTDFNGGRSIKLYAEELGGTDFISCNYYLTGGGAQLRPCEMPEEKVRDFVLGYRPA